MRSAVANSILYATLPERQALGILSCLSPALADSAPPFAPRGPPVSESQKPPQKSLGPAQATQASPGLHPGANIVIIPPRTLIAYDT